jgi:hypothetical protein
LARHGVDGQADRRVLNSAFVVQSRSALVRAGRIAYDHAMAAALSPEEQILALRRALAERDATIAALTTGLAAEQAAHEARRAETAVVKVRLTTVLRKRRCLALLPFLL